MSINQRNREISEILTDATPNWTPTVGQSRLARVEDTAILYYFNKSNVWVRIDLSTATSNLGYSLVSNLTEFDALVSASTPGPWIIMDDFTLTADRAIPTGVILKFNGGVINGGGFTITGTNTIIDGAPKKHFENAIFAGTWNNEYTLTEWFGAVGDGTTDDTDAFNDAESIGCTIKLLDKVYAVNDLIITSHFDGKDGWLKFNKVSDGYVIDITGTNQNISCNVDCDLDGNCLAGIKVNGDDNNLDLVVKNPNSTTGNNYGIAIYGDNNLFTNILVHDATSTNTNDSMPQCVAFGDTMTGNHIVNAIFRDIDCTALALNGDNDKDGLGTGVNTFNSIGNAEVYNCGDNGIYCLGGVWKVDSLHWEGLDEGVVCAGSTSDLVINSMTTFGNCGIILGVQDCKRLEVNNLTTIRDEVAYNAGTGGVPALLIRTRTGQTSTEQVILRNINAEIRMDSSSIPFYLDVGAVEFLLVENLFMTCVYLSGATTGLADIGNVNELYIDGFHVKYIDTTDTLTTGSLIQMKIGTLDRLSVIKNFTFQAYQSDGITALTVDFRGYGFAQSLLRAIGFRWRGDIGPYILMAGTDSGLEDTISAAPTLGTWRRGQILYQAFPVASGTIGYVCVTAGTPGTWKTFGAITA